MRVWKTYVRMKNVGDGTRVSVDFGPPSPTATLLFVNPDGLLGVEIWWSDDGPQDSLD